MTKHLIHVLWLSKYYRILTVITVLYSLICNIHQLPPSALSPGVLLGQYESPAGKLMYNMSTLMGNLEIKVDYELHGFG